MAVSKRTRYEVLRRDDFTCRYCRSKDNELHVDHVTPVSLGGDDRPTNLVAACKDCNLGKASVSPDTATLDHLDEQTIAYEKARAVVVARETKKAKAKRKVYRQVSEAWAASTSGYSNMAPDWRTTVSTWMGRGLSVERIIEAIEIAGGKSHLPDSAIYPYTCKILWNWVSELEEQIGDEMQPDEAPDSIAPECEECAQGMGGKNAVRAWNLGVASIKDAYKGEIVGGLILQHHIDGTADEIPPMHRYVKAA